MALTRVRPQLVESDEGWSVGGAGREHYGYREAGRRALVGCEMGMVDGRVHSQLFRADVVWEDTGERPDDATVDRILERLARGLPVMGVTTEVVD